MDILYRKQICELCFLFSVFSLGLHIHGTTCSAYIFNSFILGAHTNPGVQTLRNFPALTWKSQHFIIFQMYSSPKRYTDKKWYMSWKVFIPTFTLFVHHTFRAIQTCSLSTAHVKFKSSMVKLPPFYFYFTSKTLFLSVF